MKKTNTLDIIKPINQLNLHGYSFYFDLFIKLFNEVKIPSTILLNGTKGLGKSTFIYHFINYIFSQNEDEKYDNIWKSKEFSSSTGQKKKITRYS